MFTGENHMKHIFRIVALLVALGLMAGCAATSDPSGGPVERKTAPDKMPPVASAAPADALAAVRDRNSPLFQRSVFFDFDSHAIKPDYRGLIEAHGKFLGSNPSVRIMVQGNTDDIGSREYNLALGQRRAEAVKRSLGMLGAGASQIEAVSFGEERPHDAGHDEAARTQNRRADLAYPGEY